MNYPGSELRPAFAEGDIVTVLTDEYPGRSGVVLGTISIGVLVQFHTGEKGWFEQSHLVNRTTQKAGPNTPETVADFKIESEGWRSVPL